MTTSPSTRGVSATVVALLLAGASTARAQQLEPRAYAPTPVGLHFVGLAAGYSSGGVVTDPSLPIENVHARVYVGSPYYGQTFGLFGRLASAVVTTPLGGAHVEGSVQETDSSVTRSGFLDPQVRFGVNLIGCPALEPKDFARRMFGTTVGASVTVTAPLGQYDPSKLINLGTNRWAFKPELGIAHPLGDWVVEGVAGVWLFTDNQDFYGGNVRTQDPLQSYQAHVVYNFTRSAWAAADFTYYDGGATSVGGGPKSARQSNTRGGLTASLPVAHNQSLRLTWAKGVSTRFGSTFQTFGVGWQLRWF